MRIFTHSHIRAILHETLADKADLDQQCFSTLQEEKPIHRTNAASHFMASSKLQLSQKTKDPSVKQHCCGSLFCAYAFELDTVESPL